MQRRNSMTMWQVMSPNQANMAGNVHGGETMMMMDNVARAVAAKYARSHVLTARVDELEFLVPVFVGAFVTCTGTVVYVGESSMEVLVTIDVEDFESDSAPQPVLSAFFTMVATDSNGRPRPVKPLVPETREEVELYQMAVKKHEEIKRKKQNRRLV